MIGVNVSEGVTNSVVPFIEGSKYNVGLMFERERGVAFKPIEVSSLSEDVLKFGQAWNTQTYGFGGVVMRHLFKNASPNSGVNVLGVRVVGAGSVPASNSLMGGGAVTSEKILKVFAGQQGLKDVGDWANNTIKITVLPKNHIQGSYNNYTFKVYTDLNTGFYSLSETFSESTWEALISKINLLSNYVMCEPKNLAAPFTDAQTFYLNGGIYVKPDEIEYNYSPDELMPSGLACFDNLDIQILAVADLTSLESVLKVSDYANNIHKNKPIHIFNLPMESTTQVIETFADALQTQQSSSSVGYNFWVKTFGDFGGTLWTPSIGVIIGAGYLRVPALYGNQIHYPPAGIDSVFKDVLDVTPNTITDETKTKWVQRFTTNVVKHRKGFGYYLFSSRTFSTNILYQSVHIRRVTNYFVSQLQNNMEWVIQKPITPELQREVYASLYNYFLGEYGNGAIEQSIPFEKACIISVGQNKIDRKILNVTISIILTECSEAVNIQLNRNDNSLSVQTI
jgi:hypothetical protein